MNLNVDILIDAMKRKEYKVFENDTKPYNLNLIAIRSNDLTPNKFNDLFCVLWKFQGVWNLFTVPCTTDPGLYYLEAPINPLGTAVIYPDQYPGLWQLGKHQGKYDALVQKRPITVIRDYNKDKKIDYDEGRIDRGIFGINHHRANGEWESQEVNKWSAGCVVTPNPNNWDIEMKIFTEGARNWGNSFTFTLLEEDDLLF